MSVRLRRGLGIGLAICLAAGLAWFRDDLFEKRVRVVEPGGLVRGAWQRPGPLGRIVAREQIRTVVTLTAINRDDPKYVAQERVVRRLGVSWAILPWRGSTATLDQMAEAADLLADPSRRPLFFHCVGGHHRTGLAHAAYRIRHQGWSADRAWEELVGLPWTRPDARADRADRRLIFEFAARERGRRRTAPSPRKDAPDEAGPNPEGRALGRGGAARADGAGRRPMVDG